MDLSIAYELYMKPHEVDTDTAMQITSKAGFKYVDMSIGPFCLQEKSPILKENWERWAQETVQTADKYDIKMLQAHCLLFDILDKKNPEYQHLTDVNMKLLDVCKALGIEFMIFHPGTQPGAVSAKQSLDGTVQWLLPFVERAEKLGIKLCLENIFDVVAHDRVIRLFGSRADELGELVDRINCDHVGVCWDCGHAHIAMLDQKESLKILGDKVWTTHVHDNRGQYSNDLHIPPFYGSLNWENFMQGLKEINYQGTLNFEIERHSIPLDFMLDEFVSVYQKGQRLIQMIS